MIDRVLVIDVGNTSVTIGVCQNGRISGVDRIEKSASLTRDVIEKRLTTFRRQHKNIDGAVLASVVPAVNTRWLRAVKKVYGVVGLMVTHKLNTGIKITYPKPERVGADRIANACAAHYKYGSPALVADLGTALTFDAVSRTQGYIGGVIAPGLPLMFSYLAEKTALLPHVQPATVRRHVGKSTEEAMQIGAREGYRGMIKGILEKMSKSVGKGDVKVIVTGGHAGWVFRGWETPVIHDPNLTLFGLGKLYELNKSE